MGISDYILYGAGGLYSGITPEGRTALLGFSNTTKFAGDCYDLQLNNWDINSDWELRQEYDTIICLRCAYFAKDPQSFIKKCYNSLSANGKLYVDWGLGDHWRFNNFKVGWLKDGEQEFAYDYNNHLWSTIWDDSLLNVPAIKEFEKEIKSHGYDSLKKAVLEEVPSILSFNDLGQYFDFNYSVQKINTTDKPQVYILTSGVKK